MNEKINSLQRNASKVEFPPIIPETEKAGLSHSNLNNKIQVKTITNTKTYTFSQFYNNYSRINDVKNNLHNYLNPLNNQVAQYLNTLSEYCDIVLDAKNHNLKKKCNEFGVPISDSASYQTLFKQNPNVKKIN